MRNTTIIKPKGQAQCANTILRNIFWASLTINLQVYEYSDSEKYFASSKYEFRRYSVFTADCIILKMMELKLNATEYKLFCTRVKPFEYSMLTFVKTVLTIGRLEYWRFFIVF